MKPKPPTTQKELGRGMSWQMREQPNRRVPEAAERMVPTPPGPEGGPPSLPTLGQPSTPELAVDNHRSPQPHAPPLPILTHPHSHLLSFGLLALDPLPQPPEPPPTAKGIRAFCPSISLHCICLYLLSWLVVKTSVLAFAPIEVPAGAGGMWDFGHMRAKLS